MLITINSMKIKKILTKKYDVLAMFGDRFKRFLSVYKYFFRQNNLIMFNEFECFVITGYGISSWFNY